MFDGLFIASLINTCYQAIKEAFEPTIPAENWANKELYYQDVMDGISVEQRMKNLKNGKYKLEKLQNKETHPEPHRNLTTGKIVIENSTLYYQDVMKYNGHQVMEWAKQGKYNLSPEEKEEEHKKYMEKYYNEKKNNRINFQKTT